MISDKAIEAAAKVMASQADEPPYGESRELDAEYRRDARAILQAAAQQQADAEWDYVGANDPLLSCPICRSAVAWSDKDEHIEWHGGQP